MKDYLTVLKIYHISILIISFMDFLIFLKILPSSLFLFLVILAVGASCGLSIYIINKSISLYLLPFLAQVFLLIHTVFFYYFLQTHII